MGINHQEKFHHHHHPASIFVAIFAKAHMQELQIIWSIRHLYRCLAWGPLVSFSLCCFCSIFMMSIWIRKYYLTELCMNLLYIIHIYTCIYIYTYIGSKKMALWALKCVLQHIFHLSQLLIWGIPSKRQFNSMKTNCSWITVSAHFSVWIHHDTRIWTPSESPCLWNLSL